jgi:hypothetical protein
MFGANWLRNASGIALLFSVILVVVQSRVKEEWGQHLYYGTTLVAIFTYLFLTSRARSEEGSRWWW